MARKKIYYRKGRWRRRRRYRKRKSPTSVMGPLATKLKSRFVYEDTFSLNPGAAGTVANYVFSCNGLYDPNITGTGHQPRGFDQVMTLYDHYVVIGARLTIWCAAADTNNASMIALRIKDGPTTSSDPSDIMEEKFVRVNVLSAEGSGPNVKKFSIKVNPNKFLGRSKPLSDPDLKGSTSSNPAEQAYFHVSAFPLGDGVDVSDIVCRARLEYDAILIEPKQPTQS